METDSGLILKEKNKKKILYVFENYCASVCTREVMLNVVELLKIIWLMLLGYVINNCILNFCRCIGF